ncbi:MAG: hypothetical protein C0498_11170 [Anaerolinea sp.]|nr:hypothetical protein [Anaerolinea sp.]
MHRRALALPALLVVAALAAGACGGSAPALTDPGEILTKAVETLQKAKSLRLEATVDGTVKLDLTGTGSGGDIALTGTSLQADIDIEKASARLNLAVPALLGMTAEVIVVGEETYVRSSFNPEKFQKSSTSGAGLPVDPTDPEASLKELQDWLKKPEVDPKKLDDTSCGTKSCYQIEIDLSAEDLKALSPEAADLGDASVVLTLLVEKDTLRPASMVVTVTSAEVGELTMTITMSKWDESLSIEAPPADQVE